MDRRSFLLVVAAGLTAAAAARGSDGPPLPGADPAAQEPVPPPDAARPASAPGGAAAPAGVVDALPPGGRRLALTIDDGTSSAVVAAFTALAADTGVRLTFFPNGRYASWTENAAALRPLVDSGQIALGNHTWSHPDLTTLPDAEVAAEIRRNQDFLRDVFGVSDSPFLRPPFGARNARTDRIAADLGHPTVAMWNGTLGDARPVSGAQVLAAARRWFRPGAVVVGHANQRAVTTVYDELLGVLAERRLTTVTLADVWTAPA